MNYNFVNYVRKYFKFNYFTFYKQLSKDKADSIIYNICDELSKSYAAKQVIKGKADAVISSSIDSCVKRIRNKMWANSVNLKRNVENHIRANNFVNCSDITFNVIVERVVSELFANYNYKELMDGKYDVKISSTYVRVVNELCMEMHSYIKKYIIKNVCPLSNVNELEVTEALVRDIMNNAKYDAFSLFVGRYDSLIESRVAQYRIAYEENRPDSLEYIYNYLKENYTDLSVEELNQYSININDILRDRHIFPEEIVSHKYDLIIAKMCGGFIMRRNSIVRDDAPKKIERKAKKMEIPKNLIVIILASILSVLLLLSASKEMTRNIKLDNAQKQISMIDDFEYYGFHTIYNDQFEETAKNVLTFYDEFKDYGDENFYHLGFYRAYSSVRGYNRLAVMDHMLSIVSKEAAKNPKYKEFADSLGYNYYYIEYMCDRLYAMGYTEINADKYQEAVAAYASAAAQANEDQTPMDVLEANGEKKIIKVIEEIRDKYIEYSDDCVIELAQAVDGKKTGGRKI